MGVPVYVTSFPVVISSLPSTSFNMLHIFIFPIASPAARDADGAAAAAGPPVHAGGAADPDSHRDGRPGVTTAGTDTAVDIRAIADGDAARDDETHDSANTL